jgi:hypothetical protein
MALQSSGTISLANIQTEFGGTNPISLSEYYRSGIYVTDNNTNVPTSGVITMSNFYGALNLFEYTISSNTKELVIDTAWLTSVGWYAGSPMFITVASGVYLWSDDTSKAGLTLSPPSGVQFLLRNNGFIIGKGGAGGGVGGQSGGAGGPAIVNNTSGVSITNFGLGYIAGGGGGGGGTSAAGGGGGGAGGGNGGACQSGGAGAGGAIGQTGGDGQTFNSGYVYHGYGGGAGGGAGAENYSEIGGGGGGGRILPGSGGTGSTANGGGGAEGGSAGNSGTVNTDPDTYGGGGGGGWGAYGGNSDNGGSGGAGGAAISGTATTRNNFGTIYGSVV